MLRIAGNNSLNNSHDVCEVHKIVGKYCFLAVTSKHEVSNCTTCPGGTLRSRRGGANVMNSYESRK